MQKYFTLSSKDWEEGQRLGVMSALLSGSAPQRKYRLFVAATEEKEDVFVQKLWQSWIDKSLWTIVPVHSAGKKFQSLGLRLFPRLGACIERWLYKKLATEAAHARFSTVTLDWLIATFHASMQQTDISGVEARQHQKELGTEEHTFMGLRAATHFS
eukprot:5253369-Amphidinium_carterae.3